MLFSIDCHCATCSFSKRIYWLRVTKVSYFWDPHMEEAGKFPGERLLLPPTMLIYFDNLLLILHNK